MLIFAPFNTRWKIDSLLDIFFFQKLLLEVCMVQSNRSPGHTAVALRATVREYQGVTKAYPSHMRFRIANPLILLHNLHITKL